MRNVLRFHFIFFHYPSFLFYFLNMDTWLVETCTSCIYTTFNILVCIREFVGDLYVLLVCPNTIPLPLALGDCNFDGGRHQVA